MTKQQVTDMYFLGARHQLLDIAAFLDRVEQADGREDFRVAAFRKALAGLSLAKPGKTKRALTVFSDPTHKPIAKSPGKSACGAWAANQKS